MMGFRVVFFFAWKEFTWISLFVSDVTVGYKLSFSYRFSKMTDDFLYSLVVRGVGSGFRRLGVKF